MPEIELSKDEMQLLMAAIFHYGDDRAAELHDRLASEGGFSRFLTNTYGANIIPMED